MNRSILAQIASFTLTRIVFNTMHRMIYPFLNAFAHGLGVDFATISTALAARAAAGAFSPLLGALGDLRGRKIGMLLGLAVFTGGVTLVAVWPTFPAFVAALILAVVGNLVFIPSMQAHVGDRVAYERRGLALALTEMSWSLSFIICVPLMGLMIAHWGWRSPFPLLAVLGGLAFVALYRFLPGDEPKARPRNALRGSFHALFTSPTALFGLAAGFCYTAANEVVNLVFGVWMGNVFHLDIAALGAASIAVGLAELGGESLVGALADRMGKARAVAAGLAVNSLAALALPAVGNSLPGAFAALFVFYLSFEFSLVSFLPLMTEALPGARATLMAVSIGCISLGRSLGALIGAPLYASGIGASAAAAIAFNMLALLAVAQVARRLQLPGKAGKEAYGPD